MIKDPPAGPVHRSFAGQAIIITITDLLQCYNDIVDSLSYDDNDTPKVIYPLKMKEIKNLRDFLIDRSNRQVQDALDLSAFSFDEVIDFITLGGTITRPTTNAPVVTASIATATQVQLDLDKTPLNNWEWGKRDQSDYTPLKDERTFVPWLKETMNVVIMQGYTRLFDPSFVVHTGDHQRFVLTKLLKTTQGLRFLSIHEGDPISSFCRTEHMY